MLITGRQKKMDGAEKIRARKQKRRKKLSPQIVKDFETVL
jgi:hypothetical protein